MPLVKLQADHKIFWLVQNINRGIFLYLCFDSFMFKKIYYLLLIIFIAACSQKNKSDGSPTSAEVNDAIAPLRKTVSKNPVASFFVPMGDPKLDSKFGAEIFETPETFKFILAMQYDAMLQNDTLQIPNFGIMPEIQ